MVHISVSILFIFGLSIFPDGYYGQDTFTNPIFGGNSADPAVYHLGDYYYMTLSTDAELSLTVFKSPNLTDFRNAETKVVFRAPEGYSDIWASEMHKIGGELLIYFTFQGGGDHHKMYVMYAEDPMDPMGEWGQPIKWGARVPPEGYFAIKGQTFEKNRDDCEAQLLTNLYLNSNFALPRINLCIKSWFAPATYDPGLMPDFPDGGIDGTPMVHGDGNLYMIFSSGARLWIARMTNTSYVDQSKFVTIRYPEADWECLGNNGRLCMSEGPYVIYNNKVSYLIFSASETFSPHYCLGMMSIDHDKDPMDPEQWWHGPDGPVFYRNDEEDVYCTGHAMFTTSPDFSETWMVYHGTDSPTSIWGNRVARIDKITWGEDGRPVFPRPHGYDHPQPVPSGQGQRLKN